LPQVASLAGAARAMSHIFRGRLGLLQRVLPGYRAPFFDLLADSCVGGLSLFAGQPRPAESIASAGELRKARLTSARNIHVLNGAFYFCYQAGLLGWLDNWNPDALVLEGNPRYLSTPAAVRWMKRRGRPVLAWGLGAPIGRNNAAAKSLWTRFLRRFDGLIAYSQRGADEYAALGFPREKIFVAYNAVSRAPTNLPQPKPSTFNAQPVILFVGRLQARKRVDALLRACAALGEDGKGLAPQLVIVGDGPERARLQNVAGKVYPSAQFMGEKHGQALEPYFAQADLFVLPGTGGLAVQEAMSHGLPVLVAKGDGTQDDLVRAGNGWQVAPEDETALKSTLRDALSDVSRLRRMGEESFRIVSQEINLERMVEAFVRALNG